MTIRLAKKSDIAAILVIEKEQFVARAWGLKAFLHFLKHPLCAMLVVDVDGVVVGYTCIKVFDDEAELENIALASAFQGRGYGKQLLTAALALAVKKGASKMFLEVRENGAVAISLYEKLGFTYLRRIPNYYGDIAGLTYVLQL